MSIIGKFMDKLRGKGNAAASASASTSAANNEIGEYAGMATAAAPAPRIETQWGPVSEPIRKQAARNMFLDPDLRERVMAMVTREMGGDAEKGRAEFYRRYPEAAGE